LERFDPKLRCVITLTRELALEQAKAADAEIAAGKYRGPLHGIPWGAKDLLDTAGIATTYGAEPFKNRKPQADATVVRRLHEAGAVLVAKLSLGALALNDIWFGGQTMNPWLLEEGSSGSSAGPGAATAAGLCGFSVGSETGGSIVAPSMRCGVAGLRPTYGRVPRTGAMTLCWSLDKLGPMARSVEDTLFVLHAISGPDQKDVACVPSTLDYDANAPMAGLRVGLFPEWMKQATDVDRAALDTVRKLGATATEVSIPDWPYDSLNVILSPRPAAAFEELTLSGGVNQLKMQVSRWRGRISFGNPDFSRRRFCSSRSIAPQSGDRNGARLLSGGCAAGAFAAGRNTGHHQRHRSSLADSAAGLSRCPRRAVIGRRILRIPYLSFNPPRRVRMRNLGSGACYDEGTIGRVGLALETSGWA